MTILFFTTITMIILGIVFPRSKVITCFYVLLLIVLFGFNYDNGDYLNYLKNYQKIATGDFTSFESSEEGYVLLVCLSNYIFKLDYQQFNILLSFITSFFLLFLIKQISPQINIFLSFFIINPWWIFVCQIRFYLGFLIVILACICLLKFNDTKGIIMFCFFIIISGFFHRSCLLGIIFILSQIKSLSKFYLSVVISSFVFVILRTNYMLKFINLFVSEFKIQNWLINGDERSFLGILSLINIQFLFLLSSFLMNSHLKKSVISYNINSVYKYIIICFIFLPFECFDKNYERFFRFSLFFYYALFTNFLEYCHYRKIEYFIYIFLFVFIFILYNLFFYVSFSGWFEHNLIPLFKCNVLFF